MIYTTHDQFKSPFYEAVMEEINELHDKMGEPDEFEPDEYRTTTTGNQIDPFWKGSNLGDWDGREDTVAEWAQNQLNAVYDGLGLYGNGGIRHYYTSQKWDKFVSAAEEIIETFHESAFVTLCDNYEDYGL